MKRPALGHLLGYTALTVILTAGAAQSLSGSNTVFSDDIVDGAVYSPDIHDRAVTGAKVLNDSLTGADVNENSLHPHVAFALVNSTGAFVGGNPGTTSSQNSANELYSVVFPFSVAGCAASAQVGQFAGYNSAAISAHPGTFDIGRIQARTVSIDWIQGTSRVSTAFMLTLTCP